MPLIPLNFNIIFSPGQKTSNMARWVDAPHLYPWKLPFERYEAYERRMKEQGVVHISMPPSVFETQPVTTMAPTTTVATSRGEDKSISDFCGSAWTNTVCETFLPSLINTILIIAILVVFLGFTFCLTKYCRQVCTPREPRERHMMNNV